MQGESRPLSDAVRFFPASLPVFDLAPDEPRGHGNQERRKRKYSIHRIGICDDGLCLRVKIPPPFEYRDPLEITGVKQPTGE